MAEFDFEEIPHLRPGSAYSTVTYDGHKLATRAFGFFGVATSIVHIAANDPSSRLNPIQAYSLTRGSAVGCCQIQTKIDLDGSGFLR